ncbi:MAG: exo-alpha-sialidase [Planctomycetota bacterium]|jgi:hypothetical protein
MKIRLIAALILITAAAAFGQLRPASLKHVVVCKEPGRFGGWPANNGAALIWGNEIVFGFALGWYKPSEKSHSIDGSKKSEHLQARSMDGGETWTIEKRNYIRQDRKAVPSPGRINYAHPDFAMRVGGNRFSISYDRARTWDGPFTFTPMGLNLSSRTDYMVVGQNECLLFLSATLPEVNGSNHQDRSFIARTKDGGKTFQFLSWLTGEPVKVRSVMPSTVRTSPTRLVTITRRKVRNLETRKYSNWLEASVSQDNGESWKYLCKVADTDRGEENGNPPALVRLRDGRLVVAYGYRSTPLGMRAKISKDGGVTWGAEIVLRDDAGRWDLGYPRMVQRPDGKLVTIYYYNTTHEPEPYIVATIDAHQKARLEIPLARRA